MLKSKKGKQTETPGMTESKIKSSTIVNKKEKSTLWAKILLGILLFFLGFLSLYKLAVGSNDAKIAFSTTVENMFNDFNNMLEVIKEDELYGIFTQNTYEANSDIKVSVTEVRSGNNDIKDLLNSLSYSSKLSVDRTSNYLGLEMTASDNETDKIMFNYIDKNTARAFKTNLIDTSYLDANSPILHLSMFDAEKTKHLLEIVENGILTATKDHKYSIGTELTSISGNDIECTKVTYTFTNVELSLLIDSIAENIENNGETYNYLATILGITPTDLPAHITTLKDKLDIENTTSYKVSSYTDETGAHSKLEISYQTNLSENKSIEYTSGNDLKTIKYTSDLDNKEYSLRGDLRNTPIITIVDNHTRTDMTLANTEEGGKEGSIKVQDVYYNKNELACKFSYMTKSESDGKYLLSSILDFTFYDGTLEEKMNVNTSSQVTPSSSIKKMDFQETKDLDLLLKDKAKDIKTIVIESLRTLDSHPIANEPATENQTIPETSENKEDSQKPENDTNSPNPLENQDNNPVQQKPTTNE